MSRYLNSKTLLIASIITALLYVSSYFLTLDSDGTGSTFTLFNILQVILFFAWMLLILSTSTLRNTYFWNFICVSFAILLVGVLYKIQHWEGASLILLAGCGGIIISYTIRFIKKRQKKMLDVLKLLLVVCYFAYYYMHLLHLLPLVYGIINPILFLITIVIFSVQFDKLKMPFPRG